MMVVGGVARLTGDRVLVRRGTERQAFAVSAEPGAGPERAVASSGVALASLLAMQEAECGSQQDRHARQHADTLMQALSELHLALLGEDGPDLDRLAELARLPVSAADPQLAMVLRAIRLRAGVELARRET